MQEELWERGRVLFAALRGSLRTLVGLGGAWETRERAESLGRERTGGRLVGLEQEHLLRVREAEIAVLELALESFALLAVVALVTLGCLAGLWCCCCCGCPWWRSDQGGSGASEEEGAAVAEEAVSPGSVELATPPHRGERVGAVLAALSPPARSRPAGGGLSLRVTGAGGLGD